MSRNMLRGSMDVCRLTGGLLMAKQDLNREKTLAAQYRQCRDTGRFTAFQWKPGDPNKPHRFWDSDIAKWIEASAYSLAKYPDAEREAQVEQVIDILEAGQEEDGYVNSYFSRVEPENRWRDLRVMHELYCAGHLMEAAVAWYEATGRSRLLDILRRYADYIDSVFGPREEGKIPGYAGHPEIELALMRLYQATGEERYLNLSRFFLCSRGTEPHFFDEELRKRGDVPAEDPEVKNRYDYFQAHAPLLEQTTAEGHAVRACYLYAGLADVAAATGDDAMLTACRSIWHNLTRKRMYITGGVGSCSKGERFSVDYDLDEEDAYAETCAAISLVFFASRMLNMEGKGEYADVMERALYNAVLPGLSEDGERYFYANRLAVVPEHLEFNRTRGKYSKFPAGRQEWFGCACCPPNLARLLAGLDTYLYSSTASAALSDEADAVPGLRINLYAASQWTGRLAGTPLNLCQTTDYPFGEDVDIRIESWEGGPWRLEMPLPAWCPAAQVSLNGQALDLAAIRGASASLNTDDIVTIEHEFLCVTRRWQPGDRVRIHLPMPGRFVTAHPAVPQSAGKVALMRGPLVYCLEEVDNGKNLHDIRINIAAGISVAAAGGNTGSGQSDGPAAAGCPYPTLLVHGTRRNSADWHDRLYAPADSALNQREAVQLRAVPYFYWANRGPGEMRVWLNSF